MNNGIMFGAQGPMMTGTWYNPNTGDSFTVRDCFFENNQYVVSTTDGRVLSYDIIQHYVQSDKPIEMSKTPQQESLPTEVTNILADDTFIDDDIYGISQPLTLGNINQPKTRQTNTSTTNEGIIEKALSKASKPQVVADVNWVDFPKKHIEMLKEIMGIDTKEIVEWYAQQLDTTEIAIAIHNSLVRYINDQLDENPIDLTFSNDEEGILDISDKPTNSSPTKDIKKSVKKTTKKSTKK